MSDFLSKETIQAVENADMVSIIGEYTELNQRGAGDFWGCCPFHNEKTASFHVDSSRHYYYCFGCAKGGNLISFIREAEHLSFKESVEFVARKSGIPIVYTDVGRSSLGEEFKNKEKNIELYERCAVMFHYLLTENAQGKEAFSYLKKRGLTEETIKLFRLGFAPKDRMWLSQFLKSKGFSEEFLAASGLFTKKNVKAAFFYNRIMFPIFDRYGKVVAFGGRTMEKDGGKTPKYLNTQDLPQYKKGATLYAFNFAKNRIRESRQVVLCEGYMDCISYHQSGVKEAVAPLGTALTEDQIKLFNPFVDAALLSFDTDGAGREAAKKAVKLLRKNEIAVKVISFASSKDPSEMMNKEGERALLNAVKVAKSDSDFLLSLLGKKYDFSTINGKTKAAMEFFNYIDTIKSVIEKDLLLQKLSEALNLSRESVNNDYKNRFNIKKEEVKKAEKKKIRMNGEVRFMTALLAKLSECAPLLQNVVKTNFSDENATLIKDALEKSLENRNLTLTGVLSYIKSNELVEFLNSKVFTEEFKSFNLQTMEEALKEMDKRQIVHKRLSEITMQIKAVEERFPMRTDKIEELIKEKMELDKLK